MTRRRAAGAALLLVVAMVGGDPQGGLESRVESMPAPAARKRFLFPIAAEDFLEYTSPFGWRLSPTLRVLLHHDGIDIQAVHRAQIVAAADGIVDVIWPPPGLWTDGRIYAGNELYGGYVVLLHPDGLRTWYCHLSAIYVVWHQKVKAGQTLGRQGSTGQTTGEHLHFEVRLGELALNPALYMDIPGGDQ